MAGPSPHLARLGDRPRPAGGDDARRAQAYCAEVLGALGFSTAVHPFEFSKFPGGWATPLAGVAIPALATAACLAYRPGWPWLLALGAMIAALVALARFVARAGVLGLPFLRAAGYNLEATRGSAEPAVWLVAHVDSKWQPVSMIVRVAGVIATSVLVVALVGAALFQPGAVPWIIRGLWIAALPLMLSVVGKGNHGTLDNASGVAAVLGAAALLDPARPVGIVITDAEEWGLAGARAWTHGREPRIALNCDSVDDDGRLLVMYSGSPPAALLAAVERAAVAGRDRLRVMRLIPGILADHVPLAAAGWQTLTLSRGTFRTLSRIHTSRDTLAHMDGSGIGSAARLLARTVTELG